MMVFLCRGDWPLGGVVSRKSYQWGDPSPRRTPQSKRQPFSSVPGRMTGDGTGVSTTSPANATVVLLHLFRMLELLDRLKFKPIRPATG